MTATSTVAALVTRIDRSQRQLDALATKIEDYRRGVAQGDTYQLIPSPGPKPGTFLYKLVVYKPPDYLDWALDVGEIVHNARAPLDHLVHALVRSSRRRPTRRTAFPVFKSRPKPSGRGRGPLAGTPQIKGVSRAARQIIDRVQPYQGQPTGRGLLNLNELWNIDKHRLPILAAAATVSYRATFVVTGQLEDAAFRQRFPFESDAVVAVWLETPATMKPPTLSSIELSVRIRERGDWADRDLISVLTDGVRSSREVVDHLGALVTWSPT